MGTMVRKRKGNAVYKSEIQMDTKIRKKQPKQDPIVMPHQDLPVPKRSSSFVKDLSSHGTTSKTVTGCKDNRVAVLSDVRLWAFFVRLVLRTR
jgi:hypothetical protein